MIGIVKNLIKRINLFLLKNKLKKCGNGLQIGFGIWVREPQNIIIGSNVVIDNNCKIATWEYYHNKQTGYAPILTIGNNVVISQNSYITCVNHITIGDGTLFGDSVYVSDNYHGNNSITEIDIPPIQRELYSKGPVHIGKNVWIGRNACIMPNVIIGDGAIIGANAVVTHDIPSYTIAAGVPAKVIKMIK